MVELWWGCEEDQGRGIWARLCKIGSMIVCTVARVKHKYKFEYDWVHENT